MLLKTEGISFTEMVENPGRYYIPNDFADGVCLEINQEGNLFIVEYKDKDSLFPNISNFPFYKGLLNKQYKKALNKNELFRNSK